MTLKNKQTAREIFASNMRQTRKETDLSQEALADLCGLHRTYIGSVERGERNVSIDNMEIIATALRCRIQDLLEESPDNAPRQS